MPTNEALLHDEITLVSIAEQYADEDAAREMLEELRWPKGARCPHCQSHEVYRLEARASSTRGARKGLWKCRESDCRKQFTVTVGTIFEGSHVPIGKWLFAVFLHCSSKKGMSAHQLHRMLKVSYKTAWFIGHRIRHAMKPNGELALLTGVCEADETYVGGKPRNGEKNEKKRRGERQTPVCALVERGGDIRAKESGSCIRTGSRSERLIMRKLLYGWVRFVQWEWRGRRNREWLELLRSGQDTQVQNALIAGKQVMGQIEVRAFRHEHIVEKRSGFAPNKCCFFIAIGLLKAVFKICEFFRHLLGWDNPARIQKKYSDALTGNCSNHHELPVSHRKRQVVS